MKSTSGVSAPLPSPTPPPASDPKGLELEKAIDKVAARAELAEKLNIEKDKQIEILNSRLADKDEIIVMLKTQKGDFAEAITLRKEARDIQLERMSDRDRLIAKQDAEIQRLRHPGFFASLFDKRTAYGAIAGFGVCKLTDGGTTNPFSGLTKASEPVFYMDYDKGSLKVLTAEDALKQALKNLKR